MKTVERNIAQEIIDGLQLLNAVALGKIPPLNLKRTVIEIEDLSEVLAVRQKLGVSQKITVIRLRQSETCSGPHFLPRTAPRQPCGSACPDQSARHAQAQSRYWC